MKVKFKVIVLIVIVLLAGYSYKIKAETKEVKGGSQEDIEELSLINAANKGDKKEVKQLIEAGADINSKDEEGNTALTFAIEGYIRAKAREEKNIVEKYNDVFDMLIAAEINVNTEDNKGNAPLNTAVVNGWKGEKLVKKLIKAGADVDHLSQDGYTPLMIAAARGFTETVKILLEAKPDDLETPLVIAVEENQTEIVKLLVNAGANVNIEGSRKNYSGISLLNMALIDGLHKAPNLEIAEILIKTGAVKQQSLASALTRAAYEGYTKIVKLLIEAGSTKKTEALCEAVYENNKEIVKYLIDVGANINSQDEYGGTLLTDAIDDDYNEIAKILIDAGIIKQGLAFWEAVSRENMEIMQKLIDAGANINYRHTGTGTVVDGYTPLMLAIDDNSMQITEMLIDRGAELDLQAKSKRGATALYLAVLEDNEELVRMVIEAGADINAKNNYGKTALFAAARLGHFEMVKLLIKAGADVNIKDDSRKIALNYAKQENHLRIIKLLKKQK